MGIKVMKTKHKRKKSGKSSSSSSSSESESELDWPKCERKISKKRLKQKHKQKSKSDKVRAGPIEAKYVKGDLEETQKNLEVTKNEIATDWTVLAEDKMKAEN